MNVAPLSKLLRVLHQPHQLILFIIAACASATHDIAADGYYMLAHSPSSQAAFIGVRSTFYRIASVFGQGVLVAIAGFIEANNPENIPISWQAEKENNFSLLLSSVSTTQLLLKYYQYFLQFLNQLHQTI